MTKIWCEIRENARYGNGKRDFTAAREAVTRDAGIFWPGSTCMLGIGEIIRLSGNYEPTGRALSVVSLLIKL